jgi:hypothetical protein
VLLLRPNGLTCNTTRASSGRRRRASTLSNTDQRDAASRPAMSSRPAARWPNWHPSGSASRWRRPVPTGPRRSGPSDGAPYRLNLNVRVKPLARPNCWTAAATASVSRISPELLIRIGTRTQRSGASPSGRVAGRGQDRCHAFSHSRLRERSAGRTRLPDCGSRSTAGSSIASLKVVSAPYSAGRKTNGAGRPGRVS